MNLGKALNLLVIESIGKIKDKYYAKARKSHN